MNRRRIGTFIVAGLVVAACSSDDEPGASPTTDAGTGVETTDPPATDPPATEDPAAVTTDPQPTSDPGPPPIVDLSDLPPLLSVEFSEGVEQLAVVGAEPGLELRLLTTPPPADPDDPTEIVSVAEGVVDELGSLLFRGLDPGAPYFVASDETRNGPFEVLGRDEHPAPAFHAEQRLPAPGFGYIETRDGTTLSANVVLPGPPEDGPYPTVVEYSGYTPSDPEAAGFADLFAALGYAYVGVNMRGTGCSGGSFRYFEYAQSADGYDVIEVVAAQPWVLHNEVGMVGVSYPGISQLFVAQTQPPSLAAITPFSVIDDSYNSTLYPGGILNTGFAVEWTQQRQDEAEPEGQEWAANRIAGGDEECEANQALRLQNPDLVTEIGETPFYDAALGDDLAPRLFVDRIEVPTFIAGAWQDEQTGGRFPTMLDRFTGTDRLYASLANGLHTDSIGPGIFPRYKEFLDLYVARQTPTLEAGGLVASLLAGGLYGTAEPIEFPPDRFAGLDYEDALAAFEAEPPIEIHFEQGAADGAEPLAPLPRFVRGFDAWPIPDTTPASWWLTADGGLAETTPDPATPVEYLALPDGVPATFWDGNSSDLWRTDVEWDWQPNAPGTAATFVSDPLDETLTMIGSGAAGLWVGSNLGDTDVEVTLSEIRPDGQEVYVQSGWLRASHRELDLVETTPLQPVHTHLAEDAAPIPEGELVPVTVEIFPFAHVFREGSRIALNVDAPGGNRAVWVFDTISGGEVVSIGIGGQDTASSITLPVVDGVDVPSEAPPCDSLRGQPCRPFDG